MTAIDPGTSALLCIDLQRLGCRDRPSDFIAHHEAGISDDDISAFLQRLQDVVLPNVRRLQSAFREAEAEVIHARIQSLTRDGRDRSPEHKRLGLLAEPGSEDAEFLPEVAPEGDEIVLNKTASGLFVATNIEYILHNLGIGSLVIVGVYTNECVSSAVRSASDLGFDVTVIDDATAAVTRALHEATLLTVRDRYARVLSTEELLAALEVSSPNNAT